MTENSKCCSHKEYYTLRKKFKFECAHRLQLFDSNHPCSSLHGHSYHVELILHARNLNDNGFVIDFSKLRLFQEYLDKHFDHAVILSNTDTTDGLCLNNNQKTFIMPHNYPNTSAECFAQYFVNICSKLIHDNYPDEFKKITMITMNVWETDSNCAGYSLPLHLS